MLTETGTLKRELPTALSGYYVGADSRAENAQPFRGTIYSVNLFSDVRTAEEIAVDAILVPPTTDALLYSKYFTAESEQK